MTKIQVGDRYIGDGQPCFIIAEADSNHNGSFEQAKRLIDGVERVVAEIERS